MKKNTILGIICVAILSSCNHTLEYNNIDRNDIEGYENFISKYPSSSHVVDARERIENAIKIAEEAKLEEERLNIIKKYENNSLINGTQPYKRWYGKNSYYDNYTPHSEIQVKAPFNSDAIVIIRKNNHNGRVAGHKYIKAGNSVTIYLANGENYQTFFYLGNGWNPEKIMKNGIMGGFVKDESYLKDETPIYLDNNILSYELTMSQFGNFSAGSSNENEIF